MRIPGLKFLRLSGRWLRSRCTGGALILGYHRLAHAGSDPYGLCVSPKHFEEQLLVLRRLARPMTMRELADCLEEDRVPERAVAVTFDDGYLDVLTVARPLLERHGIPATIFVVSGCLGRSFWWDTHAPDGRKKDDEALDDGSRALTRRELVYLASEASLEIGAHSVGHPPLANLTASEQRYEIEKSKATLEALIGQPVTGFSYPHGSASDLTRALVRRSGYTYACGSRNDVATTGSDPFDLPRFWPGDWDGERFARWLGLWLESR